MLSLGTSIGAVVASVTLAIGALWVIQWLWEPGRRRSHNDVIGPSVGVIGTTYAVIVAFMLSGVWSIFQGCLRNSEFEANSLVSLGRLGRSFPSPEREEIATLTREYAKDMIVREWPAMARKQLSPAWSRNHDELGPSFPLLELRRLSKRQPFSKPFRS